MKKGFTILLALAAISFLAVTGVYAAQYGDAITLNKTTKMSEIMKNPAQYTGKKVLVTGLVVDVCPSRGCWMDLASDAAFEKIQIKVTDGVMVFPMSAKGKTAKVEGRVEKLSLSHEEALEQAEHEADERGLKFDPSTITGPQTTYRIRALGAEIK
jgi:hypothetical protein